MSRLILFLLSTIYCTEPIVELTLESNYTLQATASYAVAELVGQIQTVTSMSIQPVFKNRILLSTYRDKIFSFAISGTSIDKTDSRAFLYQDCNNPAALCFVTAVTSTLTGFMSVDSHRVLRFDANWNQISTSQVSATLQQTYGSINLAGLLNFPSAVAVYEAFNATHVSKYPENIFGSQLLKLPRASEAVAFLTNTGSGEVLVLAAADFTVKQRLGGFAEPLGLAVMFEPAWETLTLVNVFVCDRERDAVVKLNFGYEDNQTLSPPQLRRVGEYTDVCKPEFISVYNRDLLFVSEDCQDGQNGRRIVVLTVDWTDTTKFEYVTEFIPATGTVFVGPMSAFVDTGLASDYLVYAYADLSEINTASRVGIAEIPKILQTHKRMSHAQDFLNTCVNVTKYQMLLGDLDAFQTDFGDLAKLMRLQTSDPTKTRFVDFTQLNATSRTPPTRPAYASIESKYAWTKMTFDLDYFNKTFFIDGITAKSCQTDEQAVKGRIYCARIDGSDCAAAQNTEGKPASDAHLTTCTYAALIAMLMVALM